MAKTNTPLGQLVGVIPADGDIPDVNGDMSVQLAAVERKLHMSFADRAARSAAIPAPVNNMETYIENVHEIDRRINGVWVKVYPTVYSGTAVPNNAVGVAGDVYFQYV